jgi:hypothetical protein
MKAELESKLEYCTRLRGAFFFFFFLFFLIERWYQHFLRMIGSWGMHSCATTMMTSKGAKMMVADEVKETRSGIQGRVCL